MGTSNSVKTFTEEDLRHYRKLTVFTKNEILHVYEKFQSLGTKDEPLDKDSKISREVMYNLKELRVNPFRDRIVTVFSSRGDGSLTFEDFLDMMSVFSVKSPREVKAEYAFRIYDFDEDDYIGYEDIKELVNRQTGEETLTAMDLERLIDNIYDESDIDEDGTISYPEFENIVENCPELIHRFRFRL
uniref:EF-hand domain-containing protein n=1 Tax=Magallana gigas TaxID=29159 RepID=A0A8W8P485_MAGGI|nr:calcium and integrin-binding protein 1-like [Crassostrea gigas]